MADLHILTEERIILQLYEITQIFVDFLQRYDNMGNDLLCWFKLSHNIDYVLSLVRLFLAQTLTADQLFRNLSLITVLQADLTLAKGFENNVFSAKLNYLVVRENIDEERRMKIFFF